MKLGVLRRFIFERQPLFRRLQMRVAGAAPPDVAARIGGSGLELRIDLARRLAGHGDLDAGVLLEGRRHGAAPFLLDAAQLVTSEPWARAGVAAKAAVASAAKSPALSQDFDDMVTSLIEETGFCVRFL